MRDHAFRIGIIGRESYDGPNETDAGERGDILGTIERDRGADGIKLRKTQNDGTAQRLNLAEKIGGNGCGNIHFYISRSVSLGADTQVCHRTGGDDFTTTEL